MSDVVNEIKNLHSKIEELIKFKKINEDIWNDEGFWYLNILSKDIKP